MMKSSIYGRILQRELGHHSSSANLKGVYSASEWIDDLDIVNELGGHTGCVNALSWSKSGRLLASGSDDTYLNIYSYQPDSSTSPFALTTSISTGHKANIFSVKFMPHSNDQTLLTCAGDSEVRIFDIEYSFRNGTAAPVTDASSASRSRRITDFFPGVRYLNHRNTNGRVYRSHSDRVKRIVTESSPYLFLTCSEDGEVRQWDLRQPSSAYPAPRGGQGFMAYRPGLYHDDSNIPPPLISYKRYHLDLNTISCSATQPQYIALGGAHLHCFLHDRRMIGRDLLAEKGQPNGSTPSEGTHEDDVMSNATRCVRRFAPRGQSRMKPHDNGHITACKISDARPNEIVVSWSGDQIYSFDLIRSPDARENQKNRDALKIATTHRKRKREKVASATSLASANRRAQSRFRSEDSPTDDLEISLGSRYGNGESANVPIPLTDDSNNDAPEEVIERARISVMTEAQKLSLEIAKGLVKMRKALFSLEATVRETSQAQRHHDVTSYEPSFTAAFNHASTCLKRMDEVHRQWRYPINPSADVVAFQQTSRRNREAARRFVQASGTLALSLGARVEDTPQAEGFYRIVPAPSEDGVIDSESQFAYDFLKAILLWIDGGRESLVEGFKLNQNSPRNRSRFPIPEGEGDGAIEHYLIPYLRNLAGSSPIVDVDASRFERDESRILFHTQQAAVAAFEKAVRLPLEELDGVATREDEDGPSERIVRALNRRAAAKFWRLKVGRGILMSVGEGINFEIVNRAFGGLRTFLKDDDDDIESERIQEDIDSDDDEGDIERIRIIANRLNRRSSVPHSNHETGEQSQFNQHHDSSHDEFDDFDMFGEGVNHGFRDSDGEIDDNDMNDDDDDDDDDEVDGYDDEDIMGFLNQSGFSSRRQREDVDSDVPCGTHEMVYRGHCNIKTVKDVNYYGLNDEYVVSGCDSGHVFIWDRKTAKLVNILEGDGEVVNVVQGHPYEPTMAVSGIDNTIKIFSPDRRAQYDAHRGINILNPDHPANMFSSRPRTTAEGPQAFGLRSCKRIKNSYHIMSQNDLERQGGLSDTYITRSMLARLAVSLGQRRAMAHANPAPGEIGEDASIVLDENCTMM